MYKLTACSLKNVWSNLFLELQSVVVLHRLVRKIQTCPLMCLYAIVCLLRPSLSSDLSLRGRMWCLANVFMT